MAYSGSPSIKTQLAGETEKSSPRAKPGNVPGLSARTVVESALRMKYLLHA
jgi:hypothetical protein